MFDEARPRAALFIGVGAGLVALSPRLEVPVGVLALILTGALVSWMFRSASRWLAVFFFAALLSPPLPLPGGNSGLSIAPLIAGLGVPVSLIWAKHWRSAAHPVTACLAGFTGALVLSLLFALLYSGPSIAAASALRVGLFSISLLVFLFAYAGPRSAGWDERRFVRYLYGLAVAAASFAVVDFYYQFPAPAGFGDQFVWLQDAVLRRAQGLFYEASTLGNFCAFFLVMTAVAATRDARHRLFQRRWLLLGGMTLGTALILSYSRASLVCLGVALAVLACLHLDRMKRPLLLSFAASAAGAAAIHFLHPQLSSNYWNRLLGSFSFFWVAPDRVLSGRLSHWSALQDFIAASPWHVLFGVGYKTLPYSSFIGQPVVADNTYLGLLVETGLPGIFSFAALHAAILISAWRAARSRDAEAAFLGEWMFCFWCGEMVQMLSGDLITYWRVLPVYFWVLGAAARRTRIA